MPADLDAKPLPPGNRHFPLLGETLAFLEDPFAFVARRVARHGPVFRTHLLGKTTIVLVGPRVSRAFLDDALTLRDGSMPPHVADLFGGRSLPLLDGDEHRARKRQVLAAFVPAAVLGYVPAMEEIVAASLAAWAARGEIRGTEELQRLALTAIARNVVGLAPGPDVDAILSGLKAVTAGFGGLPIPLPGTAYARARKARDAIFAILRRVIAEHRAVTMGTTPPNPGPHDDGLSRMLAHTGDGGAAMSDEAAAMELHHVFIAGYIVFAELAALLERLAERPELRAQLAAEMEAHLHAGPLSARGLAGLPLLERVVQETKRLTPVVPISFARARQTFEVEGYRVPEGAMVYWAPWGHDQDPATFPFPADFDPERFSEARAEHTRFEDGFAPQGMGPPLGHACPGIDYATLLMKVFTAVLLRGWTWTFPDQDRSLDHRKIPPEHRDGLRVVFSHAPAAATPSARSGPLTTQVSATEAPTLPDVPKLDAGAISALAEIVWADGVMALDEAIALVRIARASGLDAAGIAAVERATRDRPTAPPGPLALDRAAAEHLFSLACLVAASDGSIDPRERAAVAALGDRLGLDDETRARASLASYAVAEALGATGSALRALAAEMEGG